MSKGLEKFIWMVDYWSVHLRKERKDGNEKKGRWKERKDGKEGRKEMTEREEGRTKKKDGHENGVAERRDAGVQIPSKFAKNFAHTWFCGNICDGETREEIETVT